MKSSIIFFNEIFQEVDEDDIETGLVNVPIGELRPRYAKFCFLKHLRQEELDSDVRKDWLFRRYGFRFVKDF